MCTTKKVNDKCIGWDDPVKGTCKTYGTKLVDDTCKTYEILSYDDGTCKTWDSIVDDLSRARSGTRPKSTTPARPTRRRRSMT